MSTVDDATLFKLNTDGSGYDILATFKTSQDSAAGPAAGVLWSEGTLYGTTYHGGASKMGVVFSLSLLPTILSGPQSQTAELGTAAQFRVRCTGLSLSYQWFFNGTTAPGIATNSLFVVANAESSQAGTYTVVVNNAYGAVTSGPVMLSVIPPVQRRSVPGIYLEGQAGSSLNLEFTETPSPEPNWQPLDAVPMPSSPQCYFDLSSPLPPQRLYRAWQTETPGLVPVLTLPGMVPALTLTGSAGTKVRVDGINQIGPTDAWFTLDTVTLTNTTQLYFDTTTIGHPPRLYRLVPVP